MRYLLLVSLMACRDIEVVPPDAAATDAHGDFPPSTTEYWPCYFWEGDVTRCAPKCSNRTLLGRLVWGETNTCEHKPGVICPTEMMSGDADKPGAGCCEPNEGLKRVDWFVCL